MSHNLEDICSKVIAITRETGKFIMGEKGKVKAHSIETKGLNDFVSYVDKTAEEKLVKGLAELLPEAGFITEEKTIDKKGEHYHWIIDPLDGTTNFLHTVPCFAISIALMRDEDLVLGVIYEMNLDECFYAWEGGSAYLNGNEIKVTAAARLKDSLLATGFPYSNYERFNEYMELFMDLMQSSQGMRRIGSAAVDLAYVACGRFEGFYEYGLRPWDVAAGIFIVQQAGGKVTDFKGGNDYVFGQELVAANSSMHEELLDKVKKYFEKK
jgi:myo-inositol-1(or 4)-monophosphatase